MKELIFFDVDNTLLDSKTHKIPDSTRQTLREMAAFYDLGIATGRSLSTLIENGVAAAFPWSAYVCNNGQLVYDHNQEVRYQAHLDPEIVKQIIAAAKLHEEPLLAGTPNWCQVGTPNANQIHAHRFFHMDIPKDQLSEDAAVYMFVAFGANDSDYDKYRSIPGIQVISAAAGYCDIIAANSGKEVGIKEALKLLHQDSYIAFGDSDNDIGMLKNSRYAIVMGQGSEFAKVHADYITAAVDQDGIAYAWKHCPLFHNQKQ